MPPTSTLPSGCTTTARTWLLKPPAVFRPLTVAAAVSVTRPPAGMAVGPSAVTVTLFATQPGVAVK